MLRQVYTTRKGTVIYEREFGKALDENDFESYRKSVENTLREGIDDFPNPEKS